MQCLRVRVCVCACLLACVQILGIVAALRAENPKVHVIISKIIPFKRGYKKVVELNEVCHFSRGVACSARAESVRIA